MHPRLLARYRGLYLGVGIALAACQPAKPAGTTTPSGAIAPGATDGSADGAAGAAMPGGKHFHMRTYMMVLLKRGPAWTPDETPQTKKLFEGHMANIKAMARARKLLIAGPFDDDPKRPDALAGIFLFDTTDEAEVRRLIANDPAIAAGRLVPELHVWYGPAGLTYDGVEEALAAP